MPNDIKQDGRMITFAEALREALFQSMERDRSIFVIGLGATDTKGVFGTTLGLEESLGKDRVFDMPVSENAMTGVVTGAAISGMRPVLVHQRADFILMSMDQIVNSAAKWLYMFGGRTSVPITIRSIIGRGWGQGPQHSQNFQGLLAQIPGLKIVVPTTPYDAKGLLTAAIEDNNPVIVIEHRWLFNQIGEVPEDYYTIPIGRARVMREGEDITVVASMDTALEACIVAEKLSHSGINLEVVNLRSVKPLDEETILASVTKTGRLLILDSSWRDFGVSAQIAAVAAEKVHDCLKTGIKRLGLPDSPSPTSPGLANHYYICEADIADAVSELLGLSLDHEELGIMDCVDDVPDDLFRGPF